jgi:hypothetical protein
VITAPDVLRVLAAARIPVNIEAAAQAAAQVVLESAFPGEVQREFRLNARDRPDFLIGGRVVVEFKVAGAAKVATWRQLVRYGEDPRVEAIILATSLAMGLPKEAAGKPLYYHSLGRGWL